MFKGLFQEKHVLPSCLLPQGAMACFPSLIVRKPARCFRDGPPSLSLQLGYRLLSSSSCVIDFVSQSRWWILSGYFNWFEVVKG